MKFHIPSPLDMFVGALLFELYGRNFVLYQSDGRVMSGRRWR